MRMILAAPYGAFNLWLVLTRVSFRSALHKVDTDSPRWGKWGTAKFNNQLKFPELVKWELRFNPSIPRIKFIVSESTLVHARVPRDGVGRGDGKLVFNADRVLVWEDENVVEMDAGGSCTTLWMHLLPQNWILKKWLKWGWLFSCCIDICIDIFVFDMLHWYISSPI